VPLSNVAVTDPDVDRGPAYVSGDTNDNGELDTTETWIYRAAYVVPWFTVGPVENTGTANAEYDGEPVTPAEDDWSVAIVHNPDIEVTKTGPDEVGYFESVDATYIYTVENTGDCALHVTLVDDQIGTIDTFDLTPEDAPRTFTRSNLLECEGETRTVFTNIATATGIDAIEQVVEDCACWSVIIFQWQPRTIGYWGNWERHYTDINPLLNAARRQSTNINQLYGTRYFNEGVHDFLLGKPPKFKGNAVGKAWFLMEKQYLAAWFNVKSYEDWVGDIDIPNFEGSPDAAMDPNATVFLNSEAEVDLFGSATPTVMEILRYIEAHKGEWRANESVANFKTAQIVLDKINNAENNGYGKFIHPNFDPASCLLTLHEKDSGWNIVSDGAYGELFYNCSGAEFEYAFYGTGLTASTGYSLIYYADPWTGDNPGAWIAAGTSDGSGNIVLSGSVDLGIDLPTSPDTNPGAKIWLVLSSDYNSGTAATGPMTGWNPTEYLFEHNLITYNDTDD